MVKLLRRIDESRAFHLFVLGVILVNAGVVGLETSAALASRGSSWFAAAHALVLAVFVVELAIRIGAHGRRPQDFFRDPWNVFDFLVVVVALLPAVGPFSSLARLARTLRVLRIVSAAPQLRVIVATMLKSIPALGPVLLLLALLLYVYAVVGVSLFGAHDPEHWGTLGAALLTLFQVLTLEGWVELQKASMAAGPWAWTYYATFVLLAVFVGVNLFVAVVLNSLEDAREEERRRASASVQELDFAALRAQLDALERALGEARSTTPAPARGGAREARPRVGEARISAR
jgi:voltage-gated sodium channel